jgi:hypothetical protein
MSGLVVVAVLCALSSIARGLRVELVPGREEEARGVEVREPAVRHGEEGREEHEAGDQPDAEADLEDGRAVGGAAEERERGREGDHDIAGRAEVRDGTREARSIGRRGRLGRRVERARERLGRRVLRPLASGPLALAARLAHVAAAREAICTPASRRASTRSLPSTSSTS